jgi:hypothetical protein
MTILSQRTVLAALAAAALIGLAAGPARAQGVNVVFGPAAQNVLPGATFDLDLVVDPAGSEFNAFDANVEFDPAALTPVPLVPKSLQIGSLFSDTGCSTFHIFVAGASRDSIDLSLLCGGVSLTGPGTIYHLRFQASDTPQATTVRIADGSLKFYSGGIYVNPVTSGEAIVGIGVDVVGVGDTPKPATWSLAAAPNPSRGEVVFALSPGGPMAESLVVRDVQGRVVAHLAGPASRFRWDGRRVAGDLAPKGIYFATAAVDGRRTTIRFSLVR